MITGIITYLFIGFLITVFLDIYTKKSNVKSAQFINNKEKFFMNLLWPIFVLIVVYNFIKIIKEDKKDENHDE